ncbi:MAG: type II 3-dehydroquinate dehydratase [Coriobacteriales bacterium]|jgi:3-dehydroquinate dehydratase-2
MKFLLMNGPNLNMLGVREPEIYGRRTLADIEHDVVAYAAEKGIEMDCFQSNHEGALIDTIQQSMGVYDGIVYNPGAHTHYSYAIHDAITSVTTPVVEVHISDISRREDFRKTSVLVDACIGQVKGLGWEGYLRGVDMLLEHLRA